jgi:predicted dehydrogenase
LSWDLWLAGRPKRAFSSEYVPNRWRNWWGLGTGPLGDIGAHMFDVVEFALNIGFPEWVEADVPAISAFTAPPWSRVRWHFPARGGRDAVQAFWYNGWKNGVQNHPKEVPRVPQDVMLNLTNGIAFVGTEGTIVIEDMRASARPRLYPLERERDVLRNPPAKRLPRVEGGHFEDFFNAIRSDALAGADFRYGAALTEMVLLGTFAQRTGKRIRWNRELMRTEDTPEADALVKPALESGGF